jgi:hypothetical protein
MHSDIFVAAFFTCCDDNAGIDSTNMQIATMTVIAIVGAISFAAYCSPHQRTIKIQYTQQIIYGCSC